MAKKKRVKKTVRKSSRLKRSSAPKDKLKLVFKNFMLFVFLTVASLIFLYFVKNPILVNLFNIMVIAFGFVAVGLLIALLVLLIIKATRKRK
jgi:hypothetical protein